MPDTELTEVEIATREVAALENRQVLLQETLAELELALEDVGWMRLTFEALTEFTRAGLRTINEIARVMWLKNPIIKRGVKVQANYVFGQPISIAAADPEVDEVIQRFLSDAQNEVELTSPEAMIIKEEELQVLGNIFFVFFTDTSTGRVRVRSIPMAEVADIVSNPEDSKEPWFYRRTWTQISIEGAGAEARAALYPDWQYRPDDKPTTIGDVPVVWDTPVYHVRVNRLSDMKFGVSEVYASIDWAKAYKNFLEDWATLARAYSRFAHKLTIKGGSAAVAAAKAQTEAHGRPLVGATYVGNQSASLEPVRIGGANLTAEDGRRILLMAIAGAGLPETFYGDVSVGTLATAYSLDRPTELQMVARQTLWTGVIERICRFVTVAAIEAGQLAATLEPEVDGTPKIILGPNAEDGAERDPRTRVSFPPILEHNVKDMIESIVAAATLNGNAMAGTIPDVMELSRMLLNNLGASNVDALIEQMYPDGSVAYLPEEPMTEAVRDLREAIRGFVDSR